MRCAACDADAADTPDPRMPNLRMPLCWDHRDYVAIMLGWSRDRRHDSTWTLHDRGERRTVRFFDRAARTTRDLWAREGTGWFDPHDDVVHVMCEDAGRETARAVREG